MLFDSHSHMYYKEFRKDMGQVLERMEQADVKYVLNAGADLETSLQAIEMAEKYEGFYASVGCHPHDVKGMDDETLLMFKSLSKKPKVRAIGEIGLDYFRNLSPRDEQKYWFKRQIELAHEVKKPIIIHDRDANEDVMRILKEENAFELGVLMHCFSGSLELARQYVKLGAKLSIAGPVTFKNAKKLVDIAREIPLEYLMVETDAPYLTPEPFRGKRNESSYVKYTAQKIADIRGIDLEAVAEATMNNAKRFFSIE